MKETKKEKVFDEVAGLWLTPEEFETNKRERDKRRTVLNSNEETYYQNVVEREMGF